MCEDPQELAYKLKEIIDSLTSVHADCSSEEIDWEHVASAPPLKPQITYKRKKKAEREARDYSPSLLEKMLFLDKLKRARLERRVEELEKVDVEEYEYELKEYQKAYEEWEKKKRLSELLRKRGVDAYKDVILELELFKNVPYIGEFVDLKPVSDEVMVCNLAANSIDLIPKYKIKILKSGRPSVGELSATERFRLYKEHICSSVIRVAREIFAVLPVEIAIVTAVVKDPQSVSFEGPFPA